MKRLFKRYPFIVATIVINTVIFIVNFIEKDGFNAAMNLEVILILFVFLHLSYRIDNLIDGYNNSMDEIYKWAKRVIDRECFAKGEDPNKTKLFGQHTEDVKYRKDRGINYKKDVKKWLGDEDVD